VPELKTQPEKPTHDRIDVSDNHDMREWARRLGVTELDVAIALGLPRP
jgi:hypothetical protein